MVTLDLLVRHGRGVRASMALALSLVVVSATLPTRLARADEPAISDEAAQGARTHFKEGLELEKAGDFAGALERFRLVAAVKNTPQVRFHIALCEDKTGKLVAAIADYDAAHDAAVVANVQEVVEAAPKLAADARKRVAHLVITFPSGTRPDRVTLDGDALLPDRLDAPIAIDPGAHVVVGSNEGAKETRLEFTVGEGESHPVALTAEASPDATTATSANAASAKAKDDAPVGPKASSSGDRRTTGYIVGAFGVASLAASAIFYGVRVSAVSDLNAQCVDMRCPPDAQSSLDKAHTFTTLSRIALGAGLVSVGVGAYLVLTGGSDAPAASPPKSGTATTGRVALVPYAPGTLVGVGMEGAF